MTIWTGPPELRDALAIADRWTDVAVEARPLVESLPATWVPPEVRRIIVVVPDGRFDPEVAHRSAAAIASARAHALRLTATSTRVNVIVVPTDFDVEDVSAVAALRHAVDFFADAEVDYVTGQVLALGAADETYTSRTA